MAVSALIPPLVVAALGFVVGGIPAAVRDGLGSAAGHRRPAAPPPRDDITIKDDKSR